MDQPPSKMWQFVPWTRAMVAGATLDKPSYRGGKMTAGKNRQQAVKRRRKRKRRRKNRGKD